MNPILQSGMHPDADTLTAFAEQQLSTQERELVLAHMAVCNRCREVMFLAQQGAADEAVMAPAFASAPEKKPESSWLGGWRWAWIPAGAFVVLIGIATLLHFRRATTETQMARNVPSAAVVQQGTGQPASPATEMKGAQPATVPAPRRAERSKLHATANDALDAEEKAASRKQFALGQAAPSLSQAAGMAGGSIHGAMTARSQASPYGGPMANQLQQNAFEQQQNLTRQNAIQPQRLYQSTRNLSDVSAAKTAIAGTAPAPASQTTVSVNAETVVEPAQVPPAPAPPVQLTYVPMSNKSFALSSGASAQLKKAAKVALPNGATALSVASAAGRTIAIDASGALFLSQDGGGHWQSVASQWTGRAVLVRNTQASDQLATLQAKSVPRFELVTDKLETWTSADGKTWTAKLVPNQ